VAPPFDIAFSFCSNLRNQLIMLQACSSKDCRVSFLPKFPCEQGKNVCQTPSRCVHLSKAIALAPIGLAGCCLSPGSGHCSPKAVTARITNSCLVKYHKMKRCSLVSDFWSHRKQLASCHRVSNAVSVPTVGSPVPSLECKQRGTVLESVWQSSGSSNNGSSSSSFGGAASLMELKPFKKNIWQNSSN